MQKPGIWASTPNRLSLAGIATQAGIFGMMIWAEKDFPTGQWFKVQDQFEQLFLALRAPEDMMLICVEGEDFKGQKLIMSLPDEQSLAAFTEFKQISEESLPKRASLICGISHEFQQRFGFSAAPCAVNVSA